MRRWAWALAALVLAAKCGENGPVPGDLVLQYGTAAAAPRAMLVVVTGPQQGVTWSAPADAGYRVFATPLAGDTTRVAVVAPAGQTLAAGAIARLTVPDVNAVSSYRATTDQVADATYALQNPAQYPAVIVRP